GTDNRNHGFTSANVPQASGAILSGAEQVATVGAEFDAENVVIMFEWLKHQLPGAHVPNSNCSVFAGGGGVFAIGTERPKEHAVSMPEWVFKTLAGFDLPDLSCTRRVKVGINSMRTDRK